MKLLLSLIALVFLTRLESVAGVLAVRIVFNQGVDEVHKKCEAGDWTKVQTALDIAAARRLRTTPSSRNLASAYCTTVCSYFRPRTCYLSGTGCRNRRTEEIDSVEEPLPIEEIEEEPSHRELYLDHECAEKKNRLVNGLNSIQNNVAQNCRNLITSQHSLTCYDA